MERSGGSEDTTSRWRKREKRRRAERARQKKHGAGLKRVYRDAVVKGLRPGSGIKRRTV